MKTLQLKQWTWIGLLSLAACGSDTAPMDTDEDLGSPTTQPIPSGGVGGGALEGTLEVHVLSAVDDAPIEDAEVMLGTQRIVTDEAGFARLRDVETSATVRVEAQGFVPTIWTGVTSAALTVALHPPMRATRVAEVDVVASGLDQLVPPTSDATLALRVFPSVPEDLRGLGDALARLDDALARDADPSECRFAPGADAACSLTLSTPVAPQRLTGLVHAVDADGTVSAPIALAVSDPFTPATEGAHTRVTLKLLASDTLVTGPLAPVEPPPGLASGLASVVGVPGLKLEQGAVLVFPTPPGQSALLPPLGGALSGKTYWVISQASYADEDGDVVLRTLRRDVTPEDLRAGTWAQAPRAAVITSERLVSEPSTAGLRELTVRNGAGEALLEIIALGAQAPLDLELGPLPDAATIESRELLTDFDPSDFTLHDAHAAVLTEALRTTAL